MASTAGEKELKTDWPITSGLTAETTKQKGHQMNLIAPTSNILRRNRLGIY